MSFSEWIGIIGGITGIISICVQIATYNANRMHVKTGTFNELQNAVYISEKDDIAKCYLNLQIINTGSKPFVLQDVYMCRPGTNIRAGENLIHYQNALRNLQGASFKDVKTENGAESVHLPISVPAGGVFEAKFLFIDYLHDCYKSDYQIIQPAILAYFAPSKIKLCKIQAILVRAEDQFLEFSGDDEDI